MLRISHIYALISFWYKQQIKLIPADRWKQFNSTQLNSTGDYGRRCKHLYVRIIMYIFFKKKHY